MPRALRGVSLVFGGQRMEMGGQIVRITGIPTSGGSALAAPVDLNGTGRYVHWGVIQLSVANLVVIGLMVVVFVAALLLPFPRGRK
ncbi:hypothetical protein [Streptomyces canus]|uniref:hypothetical protein n=1 Tax=Streptomyces canus TaxID=58343 RepID=UPI002E2628DA